MHFNYITNPKNLKTKFNKALKWQVRCILSSQLLSTFDKPAQEKGQVCKSSHERRSNQRFKPSWSCNSPAKRHGRKLGEIVDAMWYVDIFGRPWIALPPKVTGEDGIHNSGAFVCCQFTLEVSRNSRWNQLDFTVTTRPPPIDFLQFISRKHMERFQSLPRSQGMSAEVDTYPAGVVEWQQGQIVLLLLRSAVGLSEKLKWPSENACVWHRFSRFPNFQWTFSKSKIVWSWRAPIRFSQKLRRSSLFSIIRKLRP